MNRNGQTLILFVFFVPIFLILMALIVDIGVITHERIKLAGMTEHAMEIYLEKQEETTETEIKELFEKNKIPITNLEIKKTAQDLEIKNEYPKESIFGKIIGIKEYQIKIHKKRTLNQEKQEIEKERKEEIK